MFITRVEALSKTNFLPPQSRGKVYIHSTSFKLHFNTTVDLLLLLLHLIIIV